MTLAMPHYAVRIHVGSRGQVAHSHNQTAVI